MVVSKHAPQWLVAILCAGILVSCVDKTYDKLSDIDLTINVGKGLELPLGSCKEIKLADLIDLKGNYVQEQENGDYWLNFTAAPLEYDFALPDEVPTSSVSKSAGKVIVPPIIPDGFTDFLPFNLKLNFLSENNSFIGKIKDLKTAKVDADVTLTISIDKPVPCENIYLKEGTIFSFPSWVVIASCSTQGISVVDSHILKVDDNLAIPVSKGLAMNCHIDSFNNIPDGQRIVSPGKFILNSSVEISGSLMVKGSEIKPSAVGSIVDVVVKNELAIGKVVFTEAEVKLDIDPEIDVQEIKVGKLPDFIENKDVMLDFSDSYAFITVDNKFPLDCEMAGSIITYKSNEIARKYDIPLLSFSANSEKTVVLSEKGYDKQGVESHKVASFGDLLNPIPDRISISKRTASIKDVWVTAYAKDKYYVKALLQVKSPICLHESSKLNISKDITNLGLNLDKNAYFTEAEISFSVVNSLPLGFTIVPQFKHADGSLVSGVEVIAEGAVAAGSIASPAKSDIVLKVKSNIPLKADILTLGINATAGNSGTCLNKGQGVKINDIVVKMTSGITLNLNE